MAVHIFGCCRGVSGFLRFFRNKITANFLSAIAAYCFLEKKLFMDVNFICDGKLELFYFLLSYSRVKYKSVIRLFLCRIIACMMAAISYESTVKRVKFVCYDFVHLIYNAYLCKEIFNL